MPPHRVRSIDSEQIELLKTLLSRERSCESLKGEISGIKIMMLNRRHMTEWVRPSGNPVGRAVALKITDEGRRFLASQQFAVNPLEKL